MKSDHIKANILVIDDNLDNLRVLLGLLTAQGYQVRGLPDGKFGLQSARSVPPDLILLDVRMPEMDGYQVCEQLKSNRYTRDIPVIFLSALDDAEAKVKGFEAGGVDYITKPFQAEEVLARVKTHLLLQRLRDHLEELVENRTTQLRQSVIAAEQLNEDLQQEIADHQRTEEQLQKAVSEIRQLQERLQAENTYLRQEIQLEHNFDELLSNSGIIGKSAALKYVLHRVEQVASTNTTVLILGETGTGKELIARALHKAGSRKDRPLIKVNCAALPAHLIESELFGHEKGAFTGAMAKHIGRFELANGATLFLDEIGELPLELQPKLLRVLQEGEFERLGGSRTIRVDVHVIAATNRDLETEIRAGRFREDLYYRLNIYPLSLPPLRERPEDIPLLVKTFVHTCNKKLGKKITEIPQHAMQALQEYPWPGNIRELKNVIERAAIITRGHVLQVELPKIRSLEPDLSKTLETVEREYITQVLHSKNWRIEGPQGAALVLGMNPGTLRSRMNKLGIQKPPLTH